MCDRKMKRKYLVLRGYAKKTKNQSGAAAVMHNTFLQLHRSWWSMPTPIAIHWYMFWYIGQIRSDLDNHDSLYLLSAEECN